MTGQNRPSSSELETALIHKRTQLSASLNKASFKAGAALTMAAIALTAPIAAISYGAFAASSLTAWLSKDTFSELAQNIKSVWVLNRLHTHKLLYQNSIDAAAQSQDLAVLSTQPIEQSLQQLSTPETQTSQMEMDLLRARTFISLGLINQTEDPSEKITSLLTEDFCSDLLKDKAPIDPHFKDKLLQINLMGRSISPIFPIYAEEMDRQITQIITKISERRPIEFEEYGHLSLSKKDPERYHYFIMDLFDEGKEFVQSEFINRHLSPSKKRAPQKQLSF